MPTQHNYAFQQLCVELTCLVNFAAFLLSDTIRFIILFFGRWKRYDSTSSNMARVLQDFVHVKCCSFQSCIDT